jgi:SpoVK/Ycf46/Vps4 family AAA+-type ATPase
MASPTGAVMLPLSVESANSLLRAIEIVDGNRLHDTFASRAVPLVRRFWHWLRTRHIKIMAAGKEFSGWHSEHMDAEGAVHLWDTSQVAEFMLGYRKLLNRHIASTTLVLSRLESPVDPHDRSLNWRAEWEEKVREFEPLKGIAREDQVYRRTFTDFVEPWGIGEPTNYSMLLYGPPGTGKSTFAKNIAKVLGLRMITVTVSDFLGRGSENVEARVKAIFQTLEAQSDAVILFDEIDTFLLDRDSALYREQDTLFQFLTPGMLTKIADLRNKRRSIFIIATNYANRIDPAIKRTGRIDKRYLLSLPDRQQRIDIVKDLVGRDLGNREEVAAASLFFGYSDIRGAVEDAGGTKASDAEILGRLREREPSTSLLSYARRIDEENYPSEELAELAGMANEVRRSDVIDAAIRAVPLLRRHSFKRYLH